jgi:hypothetical protein
MPQSGAPCIGFDELPSWQKTVRMPKITWAHVAALFLFVLLILGVVALLGSEKNLELKASTNEISLKTSEAKSVLARKHENNAR